MRRLCVTVGSRVEHEGDSPEDKGEFLAIDWDTKEIVGSYTADSGKLVDTGRSRGASGLAWHEDKIYVATRAGVSCIDPDTYEKITVVDMEGAPGGIHQIKSTGSGILWITHHGTDQLGVVWDDKFQYSIPTRDNKDKSPEMNGLNAVGFSPKGEMFLMYSHRGEIYNWTAQKRAVDIKIQNKKGPPGLHAPHDITFIDDDQLLFTRSATRQLWKANVRNGGRDCVVNRLPLYDEDGPEHAKTGWLRGVAAYKNRIFVMSAPGTIIEYEKGTWKEKDKFVFDERPKSNPFDIILDPRDWR